MASVVQDVPKSTDSLITDPSVESRIELPHIVPTSPGLGPLKRSVLGAMRHSGMLAATRRFGQTLRPSIPILAYHRVYDYGAVASFPYDIELVSADRRQFEWQMTYLKRHYNPIRFSDLLDSFEDRVELPARPVVVTFDDGYLDNYTHAMPILRNLGIPATVFLTTGYIGSSISFWYDRLAYTILATRKPTLSLTGVGECAIPAEHGDRRLFLKRVLRLMKISPNSSRLAWLAEIDEQLSDVRVAEHDVRSQPLSWDQVVEMADAGFEFGSHTVSHPILTRCTPEEVRFELAESFATLQRHLDTFTPVLSYPVGGAGAFSAAIVDEARRCGYRLATSYIHGLNRLSALDRFGLRRIHVERYHDQDYFMAALELPSWF